MHYTTPCLRDLRRTVGRNIHHYRAGKRMLLSELARLSGLHERMLDRFEIGGGDLTLHTLFRISCALGVGVDSLIRTPSSSARPVSPASFRASEC